jgi:protein ImuB
MQLAQVRMGGLVSSVSVTVTASAALVNRQERLFDDGRSAQDTRQLIALVDRLTGRLGRRAVVRVRMVSDVAPERAFCDEPLVAGGQERVLSAGNFLGETPFEPFRKGVPDTLLPQRPLHVFSRPKPVAVVSVVPEGPPVQFPVAGRRHHVARHWGPERIETGWWRNDPVRRDYYRIETTRGYRFWLFRRLQDGKWFLHGVFE